MRLLKNRVFTFGCVMMLMVIIIVAQLLNLQIAAGADSLVSSNATKQKTKSVSGQRGRIFDVNMVPLAYDVDCYNIQFHRDPNRSREQDFQEYSRVLLDAIDIIESNGFATIDTFYMKKDAAGNIYFDWGTTNEDAQATREKYWRLNFGQKTAAADNRTPQEIFDAVLERFGVPTDIGFERQRKLMSIWQESQATMFLSMPVTIAENVNLNTVSEIKARSTELPDIDVAESSMRVYPQNESAAHIVGYMGAIPEDSMADYEERGYARSDNVGVAGVERTMEDQLSAQIGYRQGSQVVEVNNLGRVMRELSYEAPLDGNSVVLTIDMELQRIAEEALENNIELIRENEEEKLVDPEWLEQNDDALEQRMETDKAVEVAASGAVVVMDVKTGSLKALVSYPSYDPNAFVRKDLERIDYYINDEEAHQPLFNRAIATKDTPGSIFKMVTALAGLMEGAIGPEDKVEDKKVFSKYVAEGASTRQAPKCWSKSGHGYQDVTQALENSCNYYFFEVIDRLGLLDGEGGLDGIDILDQWAIKLGLSSRTGVELPLESRGLVAGPNALYDPAKELTEQETAKPRLSAAKIKEILVEASENKGMDYEEERYDRMVDAIMDLAATDLSINALHPLIRDILLEDSGLSATEIGNLGLGNKIVEYLRDIKWTVNESMWAAIGQSIHQYSPIAIARYIAAIVNGGTVFEAQLVDRIVDADGNLVIDKQPVVVNTIEGAEAYLPYIKRGMSKVVETDDEGHGGTGSEPFKGFEYSEDIGGKTGTAEKNDIDIENNAWFVAFAPYEEPEIAVVVYIPSGLSGGSAGWCARDILQYWMDDKELSGNDVPSYGILIP